MNSTNNDWLEHCNPNISNIKPYQPGKPESELIRELGISQKQIVKLNSNENILGCSPKVLESLKEFSLSPNLHHYPDGNGFELKQQLSSFHQVEQNQLTLANGSNDILDIIGRVFLNHESSAIYSEYAFIVYKLTTLSQNAESIVIPSVNYGHDLESMSKVIKNNTRVIFIANPNNPTGTYCSSEQLHHFLKLIPNNIIVVLDEAYHEFIPENVQQNHIAWLKKFPNLIITRTFSKGYGLAQLRIGYSISNATINDLLNRVRQPFNTNGMAQRMAQVALSDQEHIRLSRTSILNSKSNFEKGLKKQGLFFIPSQGNFVTVQFKNAAQINQKLAQQGFLVRPLEPYGLKSFLRITIGTNEQMESLLKILYHILKD